MKILFLGDVVGQIGCETIRQNLPELKHKHKIDLTIANGENSAEGNGILPSSANHLYTSGVDIITTGNHALKRHEMYEVFDDENIPILRPANFHHSAPGRGMLEYDMLKFKIAVINLQGTIFMDNIRNPFDTIDTLLEKSQTPNIIVDFHAEATSEKLAIAHYLDGRVSAVLGTHTHVATADEQILPNGTAFISDAGMCGGANSILGVRPDLVIKRLVTNLPVRFENVKDNGMINGVVVDLDTTSGKAQNIYRVYIK